MNIGYACICIGSERFRQRTCIQKFATENALYEIIAFNLQSLQTILVYNVEHGIRMFRLSSDLIPFGSSPVNTLHWKHLFKLEFEELGRYIKKHSLRVSMHPGQYTLLNAIDEEIVKRSIADLRYHCDVLDALGLDSTHKMILHIGGVYGDKENAMKRFIKVYQTLDDTIKKRLVIENDDHYYHIEDVLAIAEVCQMPVVFDNLHHTILPPKVKRTIYEWLHIVNTTWKKQDGVQKIHYSEQDTSKRVGAHARSISIDPFLSFVKQIPFPIDIMLEVKDKNISALKAHYLLDQKDESFYLEWDHYRYVFYLHSLAYYVKYAYLFREQKVIDRNAFYHMADEFLKNEVMQENYRMLFHFIKLRWYDKLTQRSQKLFDRFVNRYMENEICAQACCAGFARIAQREHIQEGIDGLLLL